LGRLGDGARLSRRRLASRLRHGHDHSRDRHAHRRGNVGCRRRRRRWWIRSLRSGLRERVEDRWTRVLARRRWPIARIVVVVLCRLGVR